MTARVTIVDDRAERAYEGRVVRESHPRLTQLLLGLVAAVLVYTVHRAAILRIEYWDGWTFLLNARALVSDRAAYYTAQRPPWIALVQVAPVALTGGTEPGSASRLIVPHLVAALLSSLTAGAIFLAYRPPLGTALAALGTLLFVGTPLFVRYGAHVMSDLPSAGWAAATVALYLKARARPGIALYLWCGLAFGFAILTRYQLVALAGVLAVAEVAHVVREQRVDVRKAIGLAACFTAAAALFLAVQAVIAFKFWGDVGAYYSVLRKVATAPDEFARTHGESWRDFITMAPATITTPVLLLTTIGLAGLVRGCSPSDAAFLAWLLLVGPGTLLFTMHSEARYLFPALPPVLYFAVRGVRDLSRRRIGAVVGVVLVVWALVHGVRQGIFDRDPVFRDDVELRAAKALLHARGPGGRLLWMGDMHTFPTRTPRLVPEDEFFNTFHYGPPVVQYLADEPVVPASADSRAALAALVSDGDAIVRAADQMFETDTIPVGGVPPLEVWRAHRVEFRRVPSGEFVPATTRGMRVEADPAGTLRLTAAENAGTWDVLVAGESRGQRWHLGLREIAPGDGIPIATRAPVASVVLVHFDRTVF